MDEKEGESLSPAEASYFESRGMSDIPDLGVEVEKPASETPDASSASNDDADVAEAEADATEAEQPGKPTGQSKVPLAALTKTRGELKTERTAREAAERKAAVLEDRWNRVLQAQTQQQEQQKPAAEEIPDPELHPDKALAWAIGFVKQQKAAQAQQQTQTVEQQRANREWNDTYQAVNQRYTAAAEADPLVNEARDFMINSIGEEAMAMGLTREQAQAEISRVEAEHIKFAHKRNLDPGAYVKSLAKARGWNGKAKVVPPKEDANNEASDLNKLAEAADNAISLSDTSGASPKTVDAAAVANMNEADFAKWLAKNPDKFRKLAGG